MGGGKLSIQLKDADGNSLIELFLDFFQSWYFSILLSQHIQTIVWILN